MIKPLDYYNLQDRLFKKALRKVFPMKALFELTYRCNLKCRHCYVVPPDKMAGISTDMHTDWHGLRRELNTKEVFMILDQLAEAGCLNIGFTGGEPFIREDILDILGYAKKKGFNVIVLTNGTLITPKKADRLKDLDLNKIDISFYTTNGETFDWFTQIPGTYRKVLRSVKLLRERGIEVYLKVTAMTINKDDMVNIRNFAVERLGVHFRWAPEVTLAWDGAKDNLNFRLAPEDLQRIIRNMVEDTEMECGKFCDLEKENRTPASRKRNSHKINQRRLFRCGAGKTEVVINPYGEMRLCMDIPGSNYNILSGGFAKGWKLLSDYARNTLPGPSYQCDKCELSQYCSFCPARGWMECGDMSACSAYYRQAAKLAKSQAERNKSTVDSP